MKNRVLLLSLLTLCISNYSFSQEKTIADFRNHEVYLEINDALPVSIFYAFADAFTGIIVAPFSKNKKVDEESKWFPYISAGYNYHLKPWLAIGGDVGFLLGSDTKTYKHKDTGVMSTYKRDFNMSSLSANAKFIYVNKPFFQFYGRVTAGVLMFNSSSEKNVGGTITKSDPTTDYNAMVQVMPIGLRVGGKLAGHFEAGFGVKGFIGLGIDYSF